MFMAVLPMLAVVAAVAVTSDRWEDRYYGRVTIACYLAVILATSI
jgi:hypothetical protein